MQFPCWPCGGMRGTSFSLSLSLSAPTFQNHENVESNKKTPWKCKLDRHKFSKCVLYFLDFISFVWTKQNKKKIKVDTSMVLCKDHHKNVP